jgi:hypothetical protein
MTTKKEPRGFPSRCVALLALLVSSWLHGSHAQAQSAQAAYDIDSRRLKVGTMDYTRGRITHKGQPATRIETITTEEGILSALDDLARSQ